MQTLHTTRTPREALSSLPLPGLPGPPSGPRRKRPPCPPCRRRTRAFLPPRRCWCTTAAPSAATPSPRAAPAGRSYGRETIRDAAQTTGGGGKGKPDRLMGDNETKNAAEADVSVMSKETHAAYYCSPVRFLDASLDRSPSLPLAFCRRVVGSAIFPSLPPCLPRHASSQAWPAA